MLKEKYLLLDAPNIFGKPIFHLLHWGQANFEILSRTESVMMTDDDRRHKMRWQSNPYMPCSINAGDTKTYYFLSLNYTFIILDITFTISFHHVMVCFQWIGLTYKLLRAEASEIQQIVNDAYTELDAVEKALSAAGKTFFGGRK